jgi:signal transduction histidine kinase
VRAAGAQKRHEAILELAALDKRDVSTALRRILESDAAVLDVERVNRWEFTTRPRGIQCVLGYLRGPRRFEAGDVLEASAFPGYFEALARDPMILAADAWRDPRTRQLRERYLEPRGITSMMDVPVWVRGSLWGVICHEHVGPARRWTPAERDFATSIGHIVSMTLEARDRARAEQVARASETVVGILSHDLRTPLTTIRSSAQHLASLGDHRATTAAQRILRSADRMTRMIDQLLDLSRIRLGGGLLVQRQDVDLGELCRNVATDAQATSRTPPILVRSTGDPTGQWDPDRIWQVVANLVANAIEHGDPEASIEVEVDGTHPDDVQVQVKNRGEIEAERASSILEPFHEATSTASRRRGKGLGLGLYITREIVSAHGGTLRISGDTGCTIVTFRLPRAR